VIVAGFLFFHDEGVISPDPRRKTHTSPSYRSPAGKPNT